MWMLLMIVAMTPASPRCSGWGSSVSSTGESSATSYLRLHPVQTKRSRESSLWTPSCLGSITSTPTCAGHSILKSRRLFTLSCRICPEDSSCHLQSTHYSSASTTTSWPRCTTNRTSVTDGTQGTNRQTKKPIRFSLILRITARRSCSSIWMGMNQSIMLMWRGPSAAISCILASQGRATFSISRWQTKAKIWGETRPASECWAVTISSQQFPHRQKSKILTLTKEWPRCTN